MAKVCKEIQEWVEEEVAKPIEKWVKKEEKKCKKKKCKKWCLCCNKWFCWIETFFVKVVAWVVVIVGKWVTRTACETVDAVVDVITNIIGGIYDILAGIFTWDWARVWDGLVGIVGGVVGFVLPILRIVFLGDTIDFIRDEINKARLRGYVRKLLENKYKGELLEAIKDALGVDYGVFGFRIAAKVLRTYVRSDYKSNASAPPDLVLWHEDNDLRIDLKELCGFSYSEFWRRFRPEVVPSNLSEDDLKQYISSRGSKGKTFSVFCMSKATLQTKLDAAAEKGRELGLIFKWMVDDVQVTNPEYVRHKGLDTGMASQSLVNFLAEVGGRKRKSLDPNGAQEDLCMVLLGGVFWYTDNLNGLSVHLYDGTCFDGKLFVGEDASGATFKDRIPDFVWKYVPIHEIGHYFGLCHADGLDRIMFKPKEKLWWSWSLLPEYIYLSGEPKFTLDEAKKAWDYIVEHFRPECLATRAE